MKCERCKKPHDGSYGSGRFCSKACVCSYATSLHRMEINQRISSAMKGRPAGGSPFKRGFDPRRRRITKVIRAKAHAVLRDVLAEKWRGIVEVINSDASVKKGQLRRFLLETAKSCQCCGLSLWQGFPLMLEIHHKDGNRHHNRLSNVQLLCPNCHSQTPNFRNAKRAPSGEAET